MDEGNAVIITRGRYSFAFVFDPDTLEEAVATAYRWAADRLMPEFNKDMAAMMECNARAVVRDNANN